MLLVVIDPTGAQIWSTFYRYNSDGQLIWIAQPSAVNGYDDSYDDLLNSNATTGLYQYLNNSTGLINVTNYYTSTGSGAVLDYVENENVREGQSGSDVKVKGYTYTSNIDSAGNAVYPVATITLYPDASDPTITITTSFAYTFYSGTNQIQQRTTTLPIVSTIQNGSGTADTIVENFDINGNRTETTDERGFVNDYAYADAVLGAVTQQTLNVQSGVTAPGVNVVTGFDYDDQGRITQTLGPAHTVVLAGVATPVQSVTWNVYIQSVKPTSGTWGPDQVLTGNGYFNPATSAYTLIDPVSITSMDKNGRATDQITSARTTGSGALSPTDTFAQSDWRSWSSTQYDQQGHMVSQRTYFLIPSSGTGTAGTNYAETDYGYDALERQNRVVSPVGTITRTVWTTPQWVLSVWMGTDDTGATDSDPTGGGATGNNMVKISENQYDDGSAGGNGNVTEVTLFVSGTSGDTRVTSFAYDFRNRQINMTGEIDVYAAYTFDNLNRRTQIDRYDTSATGNLIGRSQMLFDDRGNMYQQIIYAVDPATGTIGNALTGNHWFDPSGNAIQSIAPGAGKVFTKNTINGIGWVTGTYTGYNTTGTSYAQANTISGDIIVTQSVPTYNEVGSVISTASFDRLNDATATTTGALTSSNGRISYTAAWFDGIDRNIASANYGAISSFTRPDTPPSSSATLVTLPAYDNAGRMYQVTDPKGIIGQTGFDAASRTIQTIEDVGGVNRTTNLTHTLDNQIKTLTAVNPVTGDQTTTWTYGTTLTESGVARNDLPRYIDYPDSKAPVWPSLSVDDWANLGVAGWDQLQVNPVSDRVALTYNRLGEVATRTDQRGTVLSFLRDKLGRRTNDCVPTVGADTDGAVLQIEWDYEVRGLVQTISSRDSATPGSGRILNQVQMAYNTFSQLALEQQEHTGAVTGSTPSVGYGYETGASGSNQIRLNQLTYPNGRTIGYSFGTAGGMNDYLNRIEAIQDTTSGTTNLAEYIYLGMDSVVRITYPEPSIWLDLWGGTSGVFAGLDLFNRVIDQNWQNNITSTPTDIDRYQYGYDQNSNRLWKANVVGTAAVTTGLDESYTYDNLDRLTQMQRGVLSGGAITGTPAREMDYILDPTGNWSAYLTKSSGTTDLNQTRSHSTVNEITAFGGTPTWATPPAYDAAGNMSSFPEPASPTSARAALYDAWNRMVSVSDTGGSVATYEYDGRNFRIVRFTAATSETRHIFWASNWRDIEERVGTSTTMDVQHAWGVRYVDELVCRDDGTPQRLYACQDANFNLTAITGASGIAVERYAFDPYGARLIYDASWTAQSGSSYSWIIGHQGLPHDEECGLMYNRRRYLLPNLGRFANWDPADGASGENPQSARSGRRNPSGAQYLDGPSLYQYLASNPINAVDPSGLCAKCAVRTPQSPQGAPCFAVLKYRPVNDWRARLIGANHSFWWVQGSDGTQHILSGGPIAGAPPWPATKNVLDAWVVNNTTTNVDNSGAAQAWSSGTSAANCAGVDAMIAAVKAWPFNAIPYDATSGPNSNGAASFLGTVGGFVPTPPPHVPGWDSADEIRLDYYIAQGC